MSNYNAAFLGVLGSGVWLYDLNSPPNISALTISGYFVSNIGKFDNLTSNCFAAFGYSGAPLINGMSGDSANNYDVFDPTNSGNLLGDPEANILRIIYLITYYEGLIQSFSGPGLYVQGVNSQNLPVQSLREGDSQITWANVAQIMSVYQKLLQDKRLELNYLVEAYNIQSQGSSIPRTLAFPSIWPAGPGYNFGNY